MQLPRPGVFISFLLPSQSTDSLKWEPVSSYEICWAERHLRQMICDVAHKKWSAMILKSFLFRVTYANSPKYATDFRYQNSIRISQFHFENEFYSLAYNRSIFLLDVLSCLSRFHFWIAPFHLRILEWKFDFFHRPFLHLHRRTEQNIALWNCGTSIIANSNVGDNLMLVTLRWWQFYDVVLLITISSCHQHLKVPININRLRYWSPASM